METTNHYIKQCSPLSRPKQTIPRAAFRCVGTPSPHDPSRQPSEAFDRAAAAFQSRLFDVEDSLQRAITARLVHVRSPLSAYRLLQQVHPALTAHFKACVHPHPGWLQRGGASRVGLWMRFVQKCGSAA